MKFISIPRQLGQAVRAKRLLLGLTQQQVADGSNVARSFVNRLEAGTATAIYPEKLLSVLAFLGLSLAVVDEGEAGAFDERPPETAGRGRLAVGLCATREHDGCAAPKAASRTGLNVGGAGGLAGAPPYGRELSEPAPDHAYEALIDGMAPNLGLLEPGPWAPQPEEAGRAEDSSTTGGAL